MRSHVITLVSFACLSSVSFGQRGLVGEGRYPQFRGISGLPGGGAGVTADGNFSIRGALTYTTPIGFTPRGGRVSATISLISPNSDLRFFNNEGKDKAEGNGTGAFLFGVDFFKGRLAGGVMLLSGAWDTALTVQYGFTFGEKYGFSAGVQDINGGGALLVRAS